MTDLKNVLQGLRCHMSDPDGRLDCENCPYGRNATGDNSFSNSAGCLNRLHVDTLEAIKEQHKKIEERTKEAAGYAELLIKYGYAFAQEDCENGNA